MKQMASPAIQLENVTKRYVLHHEKPTFSEQLIRRQSKEVFTALDSITLSINKGERVAFIGPNGSGKTTLLKIIAGISHPNQGKVLTQGNVVSLIDLEAGFHPDLTGEENIFLNGLIVGMSKSEIKSKLDDIIAFSGIRKFIDSPFYSYSQGMKLRLAFSVAAYSQPDILLIDEGIAVGDTDFQIQAKKKVADLLKKNITVVIATQVYSFIEEYADKVYLLKKGKIEKVGNVKFAKRYFSRKNTL